MGGSPIAQRVRMKRSGILPRLRSFRCTHALVVPEWTAKLKNIMCLQSTAGIRRVGARRVRPYWGMTYVAIVKAT